MARTRGLVLIILGLALTTLSLLGASVPNFPPNPYGEKLFREHFAHRSLVPLAIIVCAIVTTWIVHLVARRNEDGHHNGEHAGS